MEIKPYLFPFFSFTPPILTSTIQVIGLGLVYVGCKVEDQAQFFLRELDRAIDQSHPTNRIAILAKRIFLAIKSHSLTKLTGKYFFFYLPKDLVMGYGFGLLMHTTILNKVHMHAVDFYFLSITLKFSILLFSFFDQIQGDWLEDMRLFSR